MKFKVKNTNDECFDFWIRDLELKEYICRVKDDDINARCLMQYIQKENEPELFPVSFWADHLADIAWLLGVVSFLELLNQVFGNILKFWRLVELFQKLLEVVIFQK